MMKKSDLERFKEFRDAKVKVGTLDVPSDNLRQLGSTLSLLSANTHLMNRLERKPAKGSPHA